MQFDFWWFLLALPLFFGMGWVAARIDIRQLLSESSELPRTYFKGLNFLLNDQQDQAIESFSEVVRVSPETADLHFALGHLYRKRGEVERAIRLHEDLVRRPDIPDDLRANARYELALDFLKAGFLDRAEVQFLELERHALRAACAQVPARDLPAGAGLVEGDRDLAQDGRYHGPLERQGHRQLLL